MPPEALTDRPEEQDSVEVPVVSRENLKLWLGSYREQMAAILSDAIKVTAIVQASLFLGTHIDPESEWSYLKISLVPITTVAIIAIMSKIESYREDSLEFRLPKVCDAIPDHVPLRKIVLEIPLISVFLFFLRRLTEGVADLGTQAETITCLFAIALVIGNFAGKASEERLTEDLETADGSNQAG